ncbi:hypothetical protein L226DRAFT_324769 [Lentinus tigrinus ALCF2SS1-7]|uniref:uncharacterized protein n=1 Tax=Lentinus tigrinus ALCF2SS1-7 TaxID=1328758 RepID=UPI00116631E6|nr:hypothetical protein L226DRAFT_324769 [Lentinus tigrinus ALCF2SS1-7]
MRQQEFPRWFSLSISIVAAASSRLPILLAPRSCTYRTRYTASCDGRTRCPMPPSRCRQPQVFVLPVHLRASPCGVVCLSPSSFPPVLARARTILRHNPPPSLSLPPHWQPPHRRPFTAGRRGSSEDAPRLHGCAPTRLQIPRLQRCKYAAQHSTSAGCQQSWHGMPHHDRRGVTGYPFPRTFASDCWTVTVGHPRLVQGKCRRPRIPGTDDWVSYAACSVIALCSMRDVRG